MQPDLLPSPPVARDPLTTIGGAGGAEFPETSWSIVAGVGKDADSGARHKGLGALAERYWKPIYCYLRRGMGKSNDDAKELTQAFFLWLTEASVLERYAPDRAAFRHYLKGLLRNFVKNENQAARRQKRGGGAKQASLSMGDDDVAGLDAILEDPGAGPDELFDRAWISDLLARAVESVRERARQDGEALRLSIYDAYELAPPGAQPTYGSIASDLGCSTSDVRNHLFTMRERVREAIRAELRETTGDPAALEAEWRVVFGED